MRKTGRKKAKKGQVPARPAPAKSKASESDMERGDDDKIDYGGLPDANLKKNLGCG